MSHLNADFTQRVLLPTWREQEWVDSPIAGITRFMRIASLRALSGLRTRHLQ